MNSQNDLWLIRTSQNLIAGPYRQDQVRKLIRDGELGPQDEICKANGYWIFLHEREELFRQLGVELPRSAGSNRDEDLTETQTEVVEITDPGRTRYSPNSTPIPEVPELSEVPPENTAILSNRALREFQPKKKGTSATLLTPSPLAGSVHASSATEDGQAGFRRYAIWISIFAGIALALILKGL